MAQLQQGGFEVVHICESLGISRAAYYAWKAREPGVRELTDKELQPIIQNIFWQHRRRYGARRITKELQSMGYTCSRSKARKIMDQMSLVAIQPSQPNADG